MNIKRGIDGWYIVFASEDKAEKKAWLYQTVLRRHWACFDGYFNAFKLFSSPIRTK